MSCWVVARTLHRPQLAIVSLPIHNLACLINIRLHIDSQPILHQKQVRHLQQNVHEETDRQEHVTVKIYLAQVHENPNKQNREVQKTLYFLVKLCLNLSLLKIKVDFLSIKILTREPEGVEELVVLHRGIDKSTPRRVDVSVIPAAVVFESVVKGQKIQS